MTRDTAAAHGGMSRAAKKRAKKKKKQQQPKAPAENKEEVEEPTEKKRSVDAASIKHEEESNVKRSRNEGESDDNNEVMDPKVGDDINDEQNDEDALVEGIVSKLQPKQILLLHDLDKHQSTAIIQDQDFAVKDLLTVMTSKQRAKCLFQSILGDGLTTTDFYLQYWEKEVLLIQAETKEEKTKFDGFLSLESIKTMLTKQPMAYGRDLNVTRYDDSPTGKKRYNLDQIAPTSEGDDGVFTSNDQDVVLADVKDVMANFEDGNTIRLLCPHQHSDAVHALLSTLELEWGCMVGSNAYLTPPNASQGFAPHYDDIEAFILQLEGSKHWKIYAPLNRAEILPRESSRDYVQDDLKDIEPILDVVLHPGDVLYMPRGYIHEAMTTTSNDGNNQHSLHLTVSAMQHWAWVDFMETLLPEALEAAAASEESFSLRQGLPRNFLDYMGAIHAEPCEQDLPDGLKPVVGAPKVDQQEERAPPPLGKMDEAKARMRQAFQKEAKKRILRVSKEAMTKVDAACDQIGKRFLSDRQPPALTLREQSQTRESGQQKIWPNTMVRLVRPGIARLALEDDKAVLYHCLDNARNFHGNALSPLEFETDDAPALEMLLSTVEPHWIQVQDLIHDNVEDKMEVAQSLFDEGILAMLQPDALNEKGGTRR